MELLVKPSRTLVIGAQGMEAIRQNIAMIVTTLACSVPFDRSFATTGAFLDAPAPYVVAAQSAALIAAIEAREPRVRVKAIHFEPDSAGCMEGRLFPRIVFELKEGVVL